MAPMGIRNNISPATMLRKISSNLQMRSSMNLISKCGGQMPSVNVNFLIQLRQLIQFQMNKTNKGNRLSPPRDKLLTGHLQDTPPMQRRNREFKFPQNENKDRSNLVSGFRTNKPLAYDSCELECNEDYIDFRPEDQDFVKRSINILPSYLSQSQEGLALTRSQENVLRRPRVADKGQPGLTFGGIKQGVLKSSLAMNREYLEDKKIKNEILDQIIKNANKSGLMKSQDFGNRMPKGQTTFLCSNGDGKKAKYRIVDDDSEDCYYCSKCSIMLLQQGHQVEQINQRPTTKRSDVNRRRKEIEALFSKATSLQGKYKSTINALQSEGAYDFQNARNWLEEVYSALMIQLEQMRTRDMQLLTEMQRQITTKQKRQKATLLDKFSRIDSIRQDLDQLLRRGELSESQLSPTLQNYSHTLRSLQSYQPEPPTIKFESIDEKLLRFAEQVKQNFMNQSDSKIDVREESSIITKLDERLSDFMQEQDRKPFRNLFAEEEQSEQSITANSNLFSSEVIEESTMGRHSPKFKKHF